MIKDWNVNLLGLEVEHSSGAKLKKLSDTYETKGSWVIAYGECDDKTLDEGIACYEHFYSKRFLTEYLQNNSLSVDDVVAIVNRHIDEKNMSISHISKRQLDDYLSDRELFPIPVISIIRAAIYFYKKSPEA